MRYRDGVCLAGLILKDGCTFDGLDVHHITSRGAGGDDVLTNMILLCRKHHNRAHAGRIARGKLRSILRIFWKYSYTLEELEEM